MRKISILNYIPLLFLFFISCSNNDTTNWLKELNLNGEVKSLTEYSFMAEEKFGKFEIGSSTSNNFREETQFNRNGYIIKKLLFNKSFIEVIDYELVYDDKERLISRIKKTWDSVDVNSSKSIKEFQEYSFTYNNVGLLEEINEYDLNENLITKRINEFNEDGKFIKNVLYDSEGEAIYSIESKTEIYNEQMESKHIDYIKNEEFDHITTYNSKGEVIVDETFNSNNKLITKLVYDNDGNLLEWHRLSDYKSLGMELYTWKYEFDKYNNWVKKYQYYNKKASMYFEREIEYY